MPVIPATQEVEVGESWFQASPDESLRLYLKNKNKAKRAKVWPKEVLSSNPSTK
jgi:hypothetical protein